MTVFHESAAIRGSISVVDSGVQPSPSGDPRSTISMHDCGVAVGGTVVQLLLGGGEGLRAEIARSPFLAYGTNAAR